MEKNLFKTILLSTLVSTLALATLSACGGSANQDQALRLERPVEQIFSEAQKAYSEGEYRKANKLFDEVERQHPYSEFATQAQLLSAEAAYKDLRYDEAVLALDRFIELHPGHEKIDYAYYLKAMCYYEQIVDVRRDQAMTQMALQELTTLTDRFPQSSFARDAALKKDLLLDHLAGKEMEIGRYYLKRNEINAAINRFRTVIKDYQTTTHTPEALHRLVESYTKIGLKDEALRVANVLAYNYPGSRWYQDTYALLEPAERAKLQSQKSFLARTVDQLLKPE